MNYHLDESPQNDAEKRPILKGCVLYTIYVAFLNGKIIGVERRLLSGCQELRRRRGQNEAGCGSLKYPCGDINASITVVSISTS